MSDKERRRDYWRRLYICYTAIAFAAYNICIYIVSHNTNEYVWYTKYDEVHTNPKLN